MTNDLKRVPVLGVLDHDDTLVHHPRGGAVLQELDRVEESQIKDVKIGAVGWLVDDDGVPPTRREHDQHVRVVVDAVAECECPRRTSGDQGMHHVRHMGGAGRRLEETVFFVFGESFVIHIPFLRGVCCSDAHI